MALTLNATLDTAQDSLNRRPIASLLSQGLHEDIPFIGKIFDSNPPVQNHPSMVALSTGQLFSIHNESGTHYFPVYISDTDRSYWAEGAIGYLPASNDDWLYGGCCELSNGNIGIVGVWNDYPSGNLYLSYFVVDSSLTSVVGVTTIESLGNEDDVWVGQPDVILMSDNNYLLVYAHHNLATDTYTIKMRTSANFTSWSAASTVSISGLDSPQHKTYDVSLTEIDTNDIFLWFDYVDDTSESDVEQRNVYYSLSDDYGSTWGAATKITNYTGYGKIGVEPHAVQKVTDTMRLTYVRESNVLKLSDLTGWGGWSPFCNYDSMTEVAYDSANNKLYTLEDWVGLGVNKQVCQLRIIDLDTVTLEESYSHLSFPYSWSAYWNNPDSSSATTVAGEFDPPLAGFNCTKLAVCLDYSVPILREYNFESYAAYDVDKNVNTDNLPKGFALKKTFCDADNERFYIFMSIPGGFLLGYFDLTEAMDPVTGYAFHTAVSDTSGWGEHPYGTWYYHLNTDLGYVVVSIIANSGLFPTWSDYGVTKVYNLSTGSLMKRYARWYNDFFPQLGMSAPYIVRTTDGEDYLIGNTPYYSLYGDEDKRGLITIRLKNDEIRFHRPTYGTHNNYGLYAFLSIGNNEVLMCSNVSGGGIVMYNMSTEVWTAWNDDNVYGLPSFGTWLTWRCLDYDSVNQVIYAGAIGHSYGGSSGGIWAFSRLGSFKQPYYREATYSGGTWTFGSESLLVEGLFNSQLVPVLDEDDSMWVQYTHNLSDYYLMWDREGESMELVNLVPNGSEIAVEWSLENPNTLTFELAKGHLFDPFNYLSIYAPFVYKGRRITLKFGDTVSDTDYWQDQGDFVVTDVKITYEKGEDPIAQVTCYDKSYLWREMTVIATEYFDDDSPYEILYWLLNTYLDLGVSDMDIPNPLDNSHNLYYQWVDMNLYEILEGILNHFGYTSYYTPDGIFKALRITDSASVVHTYSDNTAIVNFTPDDSYSTFTNRITVIGESREWVEVIYNEESILSDHGTMGWWGEENTKTYYFDEDQNRRCVDPRIDDIVEPKGRYLFFFDTAGSIEIVDKDPYWVKVEIEGPNMIVQLVEYLAGMAGTLIGCLTCDSYALKNGWCGVCFVLLNTWLALIFSLLGTVANWSFTLYARPLGQEHMSFQYTEDDEDFQKELGGLIFEERIEDPFCYQIEHAKMVAEHEMMIVKRQRKRLKFTKLTHLQDELGDTIQIVHPHTTQDMNVFITALRRSFQKAEIHGGDGFFLDEIEGWVV